MANGHGLKVLEPFRKSLSPERLASIKAIAGDGARWITDCVNKFTPDRERRVDPFHVVEWATEALDAVRIDRWHAAADKAGDLVQKHPRKRGRPAVGNKQRNQTDNPQGVWIPEHPEHDGYGVSGMLKNPHTTS